MRKQTVMLSALVLLGALPLFQQTKEPAKQPAQQSAQQPAKPAPPAPIVIPPEAAKKVNPVKPTEKSIAAGKRKFDIDCAICHGKNGDGKTDVAESLKVKLPDFRDPASLKSVTDGGLFYVISKGHSPMPNEDVRAKPDQIWNLVNYIRSLSQKKAPPKSK
jgi:mono/diheme cytochrome c family protein